MIRYTERPMNPGLFVLRAGAGILLVTQGLPLLMGGPDKWVGVGSVMASVGVSFLPGVWGFLISAIEFFGGVCLVLGLFTRIFSLLLACVVGLFLVSHLKGGGELLAAGRLLLHAVLFVSILLTGPGRWSLDRALFPPR